VGSHTLEVLFSTANGSHQYINLDNLTVSAGTTVPVPVKTAVLAHHHRYGPTGTDAQFVHRNMDQQPDLVRVSVEPGAPRRAARSAEPSSVPMCRSASTVGDTLTVSVTATNAGGPSIPASSAPTAAVTASSGSTQVIAAGTSSTNLPTESVWPGAQDPPYICLLGIERPVRHLLLYCRKPPGPRT